MSSLSRRVCTHALTVMALSLPAARAASQQSDADAKAVSAHLLTMPNYKQYLDATVNLAAVASNNPEIASGVQGSAEQSIGAQIEALESHPQIRGAITATGLTPREYVLTQWALLQTGMAYAMTKGSGAAQEDVIKKGGVSQANLDFYARNEAEITRLAKEAQARAPKPPEDEPDDADDGYDDSEDE